MMADDDGVQQEPTVTSGEVIDSPDTLGEWLSPPAAADRLGMSERTLWRLVKEGRYQRRLVNRRAEILVPLPVMGANEKNEEIAVSVPDRPPDTLGIAILNELRLQRTADTETIAKLTSRLTELERENAVLQERLQPWWRRLWPLAKDG